MARRDEVAAEITADMLRIRTRLLVRDIMQARGLCRSEAMRAVTMARVRAGIERRMRRG